jgi:hypothetical protein
VYQQVAPGCLHQPGVTKPQSPIQAYPAINSDTNAMGLTIQKWWWYHSKNREMIYLSIYDTDDDKDLPIQKEGSLLIHYGLIVAVLIK